MIDTHIRIGVFNYPEYLPVCRAALTDKNNEREQIETSLERKLDGGLSRDSRAQIARCFPENGRWTNRDNEIAMCCRFSEGLGVTSSPSERR